MFFFRWKFHDFLFVKSTFRPVNHVFISSYARIKQNPKGAMTAGKPRVFFPRKLFRIFFFPVKFLPSKLRFRRGLCKSETKSQRRNDNGKIAWFFLVKIFHDFIFLYEVSAQYYVFISSSYGSVKHNPNGGMIAGKSYMFFSGKTLHNFLYFFYNVFAQ